jgi:hypothetical protein
MKKVLKKISKHLEQEIGFKPETIVDESGHKVYVWPVSLEANTDTQYLVIAQEDVLRPGLIKFVVNPLKGKGGTDAVADSIQNNLLPTVAKVAPYLVDVDPITVH